MRCARHFNASRFGERIPGCGGFIDISQNARNIVFVGTFSSGGLEVAEADGRLAIVKEGRFAKFASQIGQTTFTAACARKRRQEVLYVTERCVFRLGAQGLTLTEVAPGIDIERDILARLPFRPAVDGPKPMDPAIFQPAAMGLRGRMLDIRIADRLSYDAASNTVYMNCAGMRIRNAEEIQQIIAAVDALLQPLGRRVNAGVNCERFSCDDEVFTEYVDAVQYVEQTHYLDVKHYTSGAFLRHKLGNELARHRIDSTVLESIDPPVPRSPDSISDLS